LRETAQNTRIAQLDSSLFTFFFCGNSNFSIILLLKMSTRSKSRPESPVPSPSVTAPKITLFDINASLMAMTGKISDLTLNQTALSAKVDNINHSLNDKLESMPQQFNDIIDAKLDGLRTDLHNELSHHLSFQDGKIAALETANSELRDNCRSLSERIQVLARESAESTSACAVLTDRLDLAERESDIIVRGVPQVPGENCRTIYERIALAIGLSVDSTPVATAFRLGIRRPGFRADPPILVRFPNRFTKEEFFKMYLRKLTLNLKDIGFDLDTRIFLAESLTATRQKILQEALKLKREKKLFSVKSKGGAILVQRDENARVIEIRRLADL
jgi:hypothetical protein